MNRQEITEKLKEFAGAENVLTDEPMSRHTSFRIGGPADYFVTPGDEDSIRKILCWCAEEKVPCFLMGNGSNLLVRDGGCRGVIIQLWRNFCGIVTEGNRISAQAGAMLSTIAKTALQKGLTGFEFASGIPGTIGGAAVMNAGAYGGELKDVTESVRVLKPDGSIADLSCEEMNFGYRRSIVSEKGYYVLGARLRLQEGDREEIREKMEQLKNQRQAKQPLDLPSAGSTFKRPEGYFAGKLIMDAGLAGFRIGGAQVSSKHCGFVVNSGDASAADVLKLMQTVQERVYEQFGVRLDPEVKIIGE